MGNAQHVHLVVLRYNAQYYFYRAAITNGGTMSSTLEQQISQLSTEINKLKEAQEVAEKNVVNLVARSEFTVALISSMIANGTISRLDAVNFVKHAPVNIPGYSDSVEQARRTVIQILSYQKIGSKLQ